MRLISLGFCVIVLTLVGCKEGSTGTSCGEAADCVDSDDCTIDTCVQGVCEHAPDTTSPGCEAPCTGDLQCADDDDCTANACGDDGLCTTQAVPGCGPCTDDAGCHDGDPCTTDTCTDEGQCFHSDEESDACLSCEDDGTCGAEESCFCADCATLQSCMKAAGCVEIRAMDVTQFGEGPVTGADGADLEGPGSDIVQVFDNDAPDGVADFAEIADHDDCFAAGGGCAQLRLNFNTGTPVEAMFTSGSWQHNADDSGEVASATAVEYTQGAGGAMTYVPDGKCYWVEYFHYEP